MHGVPRSNSSLSRSEIAVPVAFEPNRQELVSACIPKVAEVHGLKALSCCFLVFPWADWMPSTRGFQHFFRSQSFAATCSACLAFCFAAGSVREDLQEGFSWGSWEGSLEGWKESCEENEKLSALGSSPLEPLGSLEHSRSLFDRVHPSEVRYFSPCDIRN